VDYVVAVIPMLGILIFIHELGHFVVAKLCGVRVLKFSLGFGAPIGIGRHRLRWERGGTEYVIAWIPLGGFVKMLGENLDNVQGPEPEVLDARPDEYLSAKPVWQKLAIVFAGPAMNLLFPVIAFMGVLALGTPRAAPVIGMVERTSPAHEAGLRAGDTVVSVDGAPVTWWEDVVLAVRAHPDAELELDIERDGSPHAISLAVEARAELDPFGSVQTVGWSGAAHRRLPSLVGVPRGDSVAAAAGLRSGDRIDSIGGVAVEDWESLRRAYVDLSYGEVEFEVTRASASELVAGSEGEREIRRVSVAALGDLAALGVVPATVLVQRVEPGLPAAEAGLEPGDLILAVDGELVGSFASFATTVRTSGGRTLAITYARGGRTETVDIAPEVATVPGPLGIEGMDEQIYRIGIAHAQPTLAGKEKLDRERNPMVSLPRAIGKTIDVTGMFLVGLGKLASGDVGADKLTGPIGIAEIARKSLDLGWLVYLQTMILISINLGILNLLPIPVLDGGQALLFTVEAVRRSPMSMKSRELVQSLGLGVLMMLMGLAFWNDLSRHWSRFVEWLGSTGL
jgi:regulator of sigma E protease